MMNENRRKKTQGSGGEDKEVRGRGNVATSEGEKKNKANEKEEGQMHLLQIRPDKNSSNPRENSMSSVQRGKDTRLKAPENEEGRTVLEQIPIPSKEYEKGTGEGKEMEISPGVRLQVQDEWEELFFAEIELETVRQQMIEEGKHPYYYYDHACDEVCFSPYGHKKIVAVPTKMV